MSEKPTIIVTGSNGQLGSEIAEIAAEYPQYGFSFFDRAGLDISNNEKLKTLFEQLKPAYFINCAAYTAVDKAETEKEKALTINAEGVGNIATLCKQYQTKLIHISTDYVFNGTATGPYKEDDATDPVNYYGYTKLLGENAALQNNDDTIIIRTSWVYSTYGNNFVKTMMRLMKERPEIKVVSDQIGSPTNAADLAKAILTIISNTTSGFVPGIYHYSNDGIISWYDFATAIRDIKQYNSIVHPIPSASYPTPAKRPSYSGMSKEKITATFPIVLRAWRERLVECLSKM